jgi:hypothetical protein
VGIGKTEVELGGELMENADAEKQNRCDSKPAAAAVDFKQAI